MKAEDSSEKIVKNFTASHGITTAEAEVLLMHWGKNELTEKKKAKVLLLMFFY